MDIRFWTTLYIVSTGALFYSLTQRIAYFHEPPCTSNMGKLAISQIQKLKNGRQLDR